MSVQLSLMQRVNPQNPNAAKKFYAVAVSKDQVNLRSLSTEIGPYIHC